MVSIREKKIHAAFDKLDSTLDRIAEIPPDDLTFEEKLTLWAQLEMLRVALDKTVYRLQSTAS
jgi:hypothetical protein